MMLVDVEHIQSDDKGVTTILLTSAQVTELYTVLDALAVKMMNAEYEGQEIKGLSIVTVSPLIEPVAEPMLRVGLWRIAEDDYK